MTGQILKDRVVDGRLSAKIKTDREVTGHHTVQKKKIYLDVLKKIYKD